MTKAPRIEVASRGAGRRADIWFVVANPLQRQIHTRVLNLCRHSHTLVCMPNKKQAVYVANMKCIFRMPFVFSIMLLVMSGL